MNLLGDREFGGDDDGVGIQHDARIATCLFETAVRRVVVLRFGHAGPPVDYPQVYRFDRALCHRNMIGFAHGCFT